ncbi:MAG: prepilin-type N-terminal cleavage/methylation domain-containing protein [Candidatus Omnitrophica bacterium]|nr:prepilin-type N-terminal cleavage/methylation domain-containing protein [Candidatus Omnitrophota bacterium]
MKKNKQRIAYSKKCLGGGKIHSAKRYPLNAVSGFTLIELMVSASILGLIGLAVLTTFASGFHVFERVQTYGGLQTDALLALEEMERDLSNAFPFSTVEFKGEAQSIAFASIIEVTEKEEDGETVVPSIGKTLYYVKDGNEKMLMRGQRNYSQAESESGPGEDKDIPLVSVKDLKFSYSSFDGETEETNWKESWLQEEVFPAAVRIALTFEDQGRDMEMVRTVFIPAVRVVDELEQEGGEGGGDV